MDKILSMNSSQKAQIYHIMLGKRRTTVSLDSMIAFFLELKLGEEPGTPEAKRAVRAWLQTQLDEDGDTGRVRVSQRLKFKALLALTDSGLLNRYWEWVDEGINNNTG
jgi:hypothetical protein